MREFGADVQIEVLSGVLEGGLTVSFEWPLLAEV